MLSKLTRDERLRLMMELEVNVSPIKAMNKYPDKGDWGRLLEVLKKVDHK